MDYIHNVMNIVSQELTATTVYVGKGHGRFMYETILTNDNKWIKKITTNDTTTGKSRITTPISTQ